MLRFLDNFNSLGQKSDVRLFITQLPFQINFFVDSKTDFCIIKVYRCESTSDVFLQKTISSFITLHAHLNLLISHHHLLNYSCEEVTRGHLNEEASFFFLNNFRKSAADMNSKCRGFKEHPCVPIIN